MELIKKTLNVEDANGWYLIQSERREWQEAVIDEETGEPVVDEETGEKQMATKSEILCGKGAQINDIISSLLTENGINAIYVSNIPILGNQEKYLNLWEIILKLHTVKGETKKTYVVTADCPAAAEKFISEWLEINVEARFELVKVNKLDYHKVIKIYTLEKEAFDGNSTRVRWYKSQIYSMIDDDSEETHNAGTKNILVQAVSFENAICAIRSVLGRDEYSAIYNTPKLLAELKIEEVFIPDENASYYSNEAMGEQGEQGELNDLGFYKAINNLKKAGVTSVTTNIE
jgi:hypothetical protein